MGKTCCGWVGILVDW